MEARTELREERAMRNITLGLGVAIVIAFTMVVPRIGTISTWKIVLGVIGLAMFMLAGRDGRKRSA